MTQARLEQLLYIFNMKKKKNNQIIEDEFLDEDIALADKALDEYQKNPKTYTLEELMKELD